MSGVTCSKFSIINCSTSSSRSGVATCMWKFCYYIHSRTCKQRTLWEQYTYKFSFCVHCREVVLFSEVQNVLKLLGLLFGTLKSVLCREVYYIISLSQRVHYWGFYCIHKHILHIVLTFSSDNCLLEEAPPFTCWVEVVAHQPLVSTGQSFRNITKIPGILCQSFKVWVFGFKAHTPVAIKRTNPVKHEYYQYVLCTLYTCMYSHFNTTPRYKACSLQDPLRYVDDVM